MSLNPLKIRQYGSIVVKKIHIFQDFQLKPSMVGKRSFLEKKFLIALLIVPINQYRRKKVSSGGTNSSGGTATTSSILLPF